MGNRPLTDIAGIGPSAAAILKAGGFTSAEKVAAATAGKLTTLQGFGPARAAQVIAAAKALGKTGAKDSAKKGKKPAKKSKKSAKKGKKKPAKKKKSGKKGKKGK